MNENKTMVKKGKGKFFCSICRVWQYWTQKNKGYCLNCFPRKEEKKDSKGGKRK